MTCVRVKYWDLALTFVTVNAVTKVSSKSQYRNSHYVVHTISLGSILRLSSFISKALIVSPNAESVRRKVKLEV